MYDPTDVAEQERQRVDAHRRQRIAQLQEDDDFKWQMSSRRGRRVVWRILEEAGVFRITFNTNALQMAFNEGARNYGNKVLDQIHRLCPEMYPVMTKEAAHGRNNDDGNARNSK